MQTDVDVNTVCLVAGSCVGLGGGGGALRVTHMFLVRSAIRWNPRWRYGWDGAPSGEGWREQLV